jgi:hypothetical protein
MGAHDFSEFAPGPTVEKAYRTAVEEARAEYGSDPYNGTISTTSGVNLLQREPVPRAVAQTIEAEVWDRIHEDDNYREPFQKWEACAGLPICEDSDWSWRTVTKTVTTTERYLSNKKLIELVASDLKAGERATVHKQEVVSETTATKSRATKGEAVTRYFVTTGQNVPVRHHDPSGYPTQAKAREAAVLYAERAKQSTGVIGIRVRESGEPLVEVEAMTTKRIKVQLKIGKPKANAKVIGGYFFGWAAS